MSEIGVTILGSTGSIGRNTLDVISKNKDKYKVIALTANKNIELLEQQCKDFEPEYAVLCDSHLAEILDKRIRESDLHTTVLSDINDLELVSSLDQSQYVVAGIVGAAGLRPTLAAVKAGKRVLLANKESLVMAGRLFMDEVKNNNTVLLPIDSEHNAIFQCMSVDKNGFPQTSNVNQILLTASGGPFREYPIEKLCDVTPAQAVCHPNWVMGHKISIDSATMMNKGLEIIEARWLFDVDIERIQVVIHPQSVIHSMVSYTDGSVLAHLGNPDMRTPIAHALAWPDRMISGVEPLDLFEVAQLNFEKPDYSRFPCLRLCYEVMKAGGSSNIVLNAANEVAVSAFLQGEISFTSIYDVINTILENSSNTENELTLDKILEIDELTRKITIEQIKKIKVS